MLGGGSAKAGQGKDVSTKRDVSADVKGTARVNVTGGTLKGVVGGGLSYLYTIAALTDAAVTTDVKNVAVNITGGTINAMDHNSGLDGFGIPASVVGGGVAYSKSTVTTNKVEATVGNVDMTIAGKGAKLSGDIYAGGFAHGAKTAASVNSTRLTIADATLGAADSQVNVFAGGYAAQGATSTVKTSEVTIANSKIFGNVYGGGNKADAQSNVTVESSVITLDGADVTGIVSTESFEPSVNAALMRLAEADTGAGDAEANKPQRTINLINSKMGTLQISAKQDTETSLYLVGSNTVGEITGGKASEIVFDGAVRLGQISTEFDGSYGTGTAKYDADGLYATAHIGAGYVFDLTPDVKLDAYGRYLLSYVEGDDVTLESDAKERFSMDDTTTHAVRLGARLEGAFQTFDWYAGLAYEHVFDGKAEGELKFAGATAALDAPSLKGDSAIVDLGFTMKPEANGPWTIGVGLKGYAGDLSLIHI